MSRPISNLGDPNTGGGFIITTKCPNILAGGRPVATTGDLVSPHDSKPTHFAVTGPGNFTVLNNGFPTNAVGDFDTCFHNRLGGTPNVLIGGSIAIGAAAGALLGR